MSGVIIQWKSLVPKVISNSVDKLCFTNWTMGFGGRAASFDFGLSWIGGGAFKPYFHRPDLGITILMLGRIYDITDDVRIDRKFDSLAKKYLSQGFNALYPFNGAGALVLFDHAKDTCFIVTDQMGFFPLYAAYPDSKYKVAICSHPDVLAASYQETLELDKVTMAEFLARGRGEHPYTYYKDIIQLDPGAVYQWDHTGYRKVKTYWQPKVTIDRSATIGDYATQLANALTKAVNLRIKNAEGQTGLLLSGGLDSRAVLFSAENPSTNIIAITFCNKYNREVKYARRLARLAGAKHLLLYRDFDFYGNNAIKAVRISGGMWNFVHAHTLGFARHIDKMGLDLVITGCYSDYLFKGLALDTRWRKKSWWLPSKQELSEFQFQWYAQHFSIQNTDLAQKANARLRNMYEGLDLTHLSRSERMRIEHRRLCPVAREADTAYRTTMWRTIPFDVVNADTKIVQLFGEIPPEMKLNRRLFIETLKKISPELLRVPDSNTGLRPSNASTIIFATRAINRIVRSVQRHMGGKPSIAALGSWINWSYYIANSKLIRELWHEVRQNSGEQIREIMGYNPFEKALDYWASEVSLFTRILTLGLWLKHRIQ